MPANVNLDSLLPREDFEVVSTGESAPTKQTLEIVDLKPGAFFYGALRKPDFQRETSEWEPKRVFGLIKTFLEGDLIPAVILWQNKELVFVIDGSHRLSALIAWVQDDYGDGKLSKDFLGPIIPEEQLRLASRTRQLVEKAFGSYRDHEKAIQKPDDFGPEVSARARRLGTLSLFLQWVRGDAAKAEGSFLRINQQAAKISPQELELLRGRRKPRAIAARAILRRGTGKTYWPTFEDAAQKEILELSQDLHRLIFEPTLRYPIKSLDVPAGGAVYSATALRMIYDFVGVCVGTPAPEDDTDGKRTIEYLRLCRRVMRLMLSNHPSSLGLHPAVYFYSWTGKQQPILFLSITELVLDYNRTNRLPEFTRLRSRLEEFLTGYRQLLNQIIRKFGTKDSGEKYVKEYYEVVLGLLGAKMDDKEIVEQLQQAYPYLQPAEQAYGGVTPTRYSTQVKSGVVMRDLLPSAPRCAICGGLLPSQAISIDHRQRLQDGGTSTVDNAQLSHPYCNTGYKEKLVASARREGQ